MNDTLDVCVGETGGEKELGAETCERADIDVLKVDDSGTIVRSPKAEPEDEGD